jgi:hypothetical protein
MMLKFLLLAVLLSPPQSLEDVKVWTFDQSIHSESRIDSALYLEPQYCKRSWFKYNHIPFNYFPLLSEIPPLLNEGGALFEGEVQVPNISANAGWPCDNPYEDDHRPPYKIPDPIFEDFVTKDADGNIYWIPNIYGNEVACASIANENYQNYVLYWAIEQVKANVNALEFDEINGGYLFSTNGVEGNNPNTGYDDYMIGIANLATKVSLSIREDSLIWCYPEYTASSEVNPARYAFDEDPSTEWISEIGDSHWVEIDLFAEKTIRQIYLILDPQHLLQNLRILYFDGQEWRDFDPPIDVECNEDTLLSFLVSPVKSQKIMLISHDEQIFLREFQIFGEGFRQWLIQKYVVEEGWTPGDPRWENIKLVDLNDPNQCPDGTINTFNYREYLKSHGWTGNPFGGEIDSTTLFDPPNPFFYEWGPPEFFHGIFNYYFGNSVMRDSIYNLCRASFSFEKISKLWQFITNEVTNYAEELGRDVFLTFNGSATNPSLPADYRLNPLGWGRGLFPAYSAGDPIDTMMLHLDGFEAQVNLWRMKKEWALSYGDRVPIVAFLDFGHQGFPFSHLGGSRELGFPADERAEYLMVYPFEMYAAGVQFCFPIWEPHFNAFLDTLSDGTPVSEIIYRLTDFINSYWEIYKNVEVNPLENQVQVNGIVPFNGEWHIENGRIHSPVNESKVTIAYTDSQNGLFSYLHIMNHNWDSLDHRFEPQYDVEVFIPTVTIPSLVFAISPEDSDTIFLTFDYNENGINLTLPILKHYVIVVLQNLPTAIHSKDFSFNFRILSPSIFTEELPICLFVLNGGPINISVYNIAGRKVGDIFTGKLNAGFYRFSWNGKTKNGFSTPSGLYFLTLKAGKKKIIKKILKFGR